jgi:prolyl-tRNA editing enzyme YbaK/EbsC (Cys-tRNA(Pro) deacylase)
LREHRPVHPTVERFVRAAADVGLEIEPLEFPDGTRTAQDAAAAVGVEVGQIVKSLAFRADDDVVLVLVSGANRLDEDKLAAAADAGTIERADADAVRAATSFSIGGVPPFGHPSRLRTFVDTDLLAYDVVWAAAGTPRHVFSIAPDDLVRVSGAVPASIRA